MFTRSKAQQKTKTPTWEELDEIFTTFVSKNQVDELRNENQHLSQTLKKITRDMDEMKRAVGIHTDPSSKSQASGVQDSSTTTAESSDSTALSQPSPQTTSMAQMYPAVQKTAGLQESGNDPKQLKASPDQLRQDIESIRQKQNEFDHKPQNSLQDLKDLREVINNQESVNQELRSEVDEVKKLMKLDENSSDQDSSTLKASKPDASKIHSTNIRKPVQDLQSKVESSCDGWSQTAETLKKKVHDPGEEMKTVLERNKNEQESRLTEVEESYGSSLQNQIAPLQEKIESLVTQLSEEQRKVKDLETRVDTNNRDVSFCARLGSSKTETLTESSPLVCGEVVTNHGNAYDPTSGIFTCTLQGTYCFLATSSPNRRSQDAVAALDIVVDGKVRGGVCAYQYHWSSGHCVVELKEGQEVWLRVPPGKRHDYAGEWWTTFTGFLLKAGPPAHLEEREENIHEDDRPPEVEDNTA